MAVIELGIGIYNNIFLRYKQLRCDIGYDVKSLKNLTVKVLSVPQEPKRNKRQKGKMNPTGVRNPKKNRSENL